MRQWNTACRFSRRSRSERRQDRAEGVPVPDSSSASPERGTAIGGGGTLAPSDWGGRRNAGRRAPAAPRVGQAVRRGPRSEQRAPEMRSLVASGPQHGGDDMEATLAETPDPAPRPFAWQGGPVDGDGASAARFLVSAKTRRWPRPGPILGSAGRTPFGVRVYVFDKEGGSKNGPVFGPDFRPPRKLPGGGGSISPVGTGTTGSLPSGAGTRTSPAPGSAVEHTRAWRGPRCRLPRAGFARKACHTQLRKASPPVCATIPARRRISHGFIW